MKKATLALIIAALLSLAACDGSEPQDVPGPEPVPIEATTAVWQCDDGSTLEAGPDGWVRGDDSGELVDGAVPWDVLTAC